MTKIQSKEIKGIAIILMFAHHLFGCGESLVPGFSISSKITNIWISIGDSGRICIYIFLFISGFGLYKSYISKITENKNNLKRIIKFLITYWIVVFFIAIPYLIVAGKFNPLYIPFNLFALISDNSILYVSFSWYVKLYLELLIILPIIKRFNTKKISRDLLIIILSIVLYYLFSKIQRNMALPILSYNAFKNLNNIVSLINYFIVSSLLLLFLYLPSFILGIVFAKYDLFLKIKVTNNIYTNLVIGILLCSMTLVIRSYFPARYQLIYDYKDLFLIIIFMIGTKYLLSNKKECRILVFLGEYSFYYWLLSGMFYLNTVELQKYLFISRVPIVLLFWKFIVLTPFALALKSLNKKIESYIF